MAFWQWALAIGVGYLAGAIVTAVMILGMVDPGDDGDLHP
jgi:hypothetical protein